MSRPVYSAVAETLLAHGVTTLFGLMGDGNLRYTTEYIDVGGRFIGSVHEGGAVSMADGFSRVNGDVGVATVTHGPGFTNTMTALVEAQRNGSALLVMTAEPASRENLQYVDIEGLARSCGVTYARASGGAMVVADLEDAIRRTLYSSSPTVFDLPSAYLTESTAEKLRPVDFDRGDELSPDPELIDQALGALTSARRPLIVAGRGAVRSGARYEILQLADLLGARVATTLLAKDYFAGRARDIGICGTLASSAALDAISGSDCIVVFGASLNRYTTDEGRLFSGKHVIGCDVDPVAYRSAVKPDLQIVGGARRTAAAMVRRLIDEGQEASTGHVTPAPERTFEDGSTSTTVDPRAAVRRIHELMPEGSSLVTDAGRHTSAPWKFFPVSDPRHFVHTANFGSIGLGLATSIGAAVARPEHPTIAVVGDGGLMMNMAELSTAARYQLPIIIVVIDDGCYGMEHNVLRGYGIDPRFSLVEWPELANVAEAFGARALVVTSLPDLDQLPAAMEDLAGPLVVVVKADPELDIRSQV